MATTPLYNPLTGTNTPSDVNQDASALTSASTGSTVAAAPNLDAISQLVTRINQRSYLSAPGRSQELENVQNRLAGNLDPTYIADLKTGLAGRYGASGFGVDSQALNAAAMRAMGLERYNMQRQAGEDLNALYAGMPKTDAQQLVEHYTLSPEQLAGYETSRASEQARAAELQQRALEFQQNQALERARLYSQLYSHFYTPFKGGGVFTGPGADVESSQFIERGQRSAEDAAMSAARNAMAGIPSYRYNFSPNAFTA